MAHLIIKLQLQWSMTAFSASTNAFDQGPYSLLYITASWMEYKALCVLMQRGVLLSVPWNHLCCHENEFALLLQNDCSTSPAFSCNITTMSRTEG
jgi:hypothetical protein